MAGCQDETAKMGTLEADKNERETVGSEKQRINVCVGKLDGTMNDGEVKFGPF